MAFGGFVEPAIRSEPFQDERDCFGKPGAPRHRAASASISPIRTLCVTSRPNGRRLRRLVKVIMLLRSDDLTLMARNTLKTIS